MAKIKKKKCKPTILTAGEDWIKEHSFIAGGNSKMLQALWSLTVSYKAKYHLTIQYGNHTSRCPR